MSTIITCRTRKKCNLKNGSICEAEVIEVKDCHQYSEDAIGGGTAVQCLNTKCVFRNSVGLCGMDHIVLEDGCEDRDCD